MRQANKKGGQPESTNRHVPKIHEERNADIIARREGKSKMKKIKRLEIHGKRWFQKSFGNTYHSVTVYVNDEVLRCGFTYGYGSQYLQTACDLLVKAGYEVQTYYSDGTPKDTYCSLLDIIRSNEAFFENVVDVKRKKDL